MLDQEQAPETAMAQTPTGKPLKLTPCGIIRDGYTIPFEIPEVPGYSVGLSGLRRPMTERQLQNFLASIRETNLKPPAKLPPGMTTHEWVNSMIDDARSKGLAAHVAEWDLVYEDGTSVVICPENVSRIHPPELMANLLNVVCGFANRPADGEGKPQASQDSADAKN